MIDEELINKLKEIITYCNDAALKNISNDNKLIVTYIITASIIRSLVYCLDTYDIENFETILQYDIKRVTDDLKSYKKNNKNDI